MPEGSMNSCHVRSVYVAERALEDAGVGQLTTVGSRTDVDANYQGSRGMVSGFHSDNVNLYAWRTLRCNLCAQGSSHLFLQVLRQKSKLHLEMCHVGICPLENYAKVMNLSTEQTREEGM